jgi:cyclase
VLTEGRADAALVASMLHYGEFTISEVKDYLRQRGLKVRPPDPMSLTVLGDL